MPSLTGKIEKKSSATGTPASKQADAPAAPVPASAPASAPAPAGIQISPKKLPLPNMLHKYASYNYIFTLFALNTDAVLSPKATYMKNASGLPVILKSGGGNPSNRVKTIVGKFDFFIDDVVINSIYGFNNATGNSNAFDFEFTVIEPFSMGLFMMSMQNAAYKMGYGNYTLAPYCLKLEFKGADQQGNMSTVPEGTRYFPIRIKDIAMNVSESGATYKVTAIPIADTPQLKSVNKITTELQYSGATIAEALQTGPKSLQKVLNDNLRNTAKNLKIPIADEIVILFPLDQAPTAVKKEDKETVKKAADAPEGVKLISDEGGVFKTLGVSRSADNQTLVQDKVNAIGASSLGYNPTRPAISVTPATDIVYNKAMGGYDQSKLNKNVTVSNNIVPQNSTVINAINQLILTSDFAKNALSKKTDEAGRYDWFRIETAVVDVNSDENTEYTGRKPQIFIYKVMPYKVHASNIPKVGFKTEKSKYVKLQANAVKVYNYIFTGKNTDILKLDLNFDNMFQAILAADGFKNGSGSELAKQNSSAALKPTDIVNPGGTKTPPKPGEAATANANTSYTGSAGGRKTVGGPQLDEHRAAQLFQEGLVRGVDMLNLEMDILGDPYWLTGSGLGNYSSKPTQYYNLNADGSVNYQNGEVDMIMNFKTPIDIENSSGLYKLASAKAIQQFKGLYKVNDVISKFSNGEFTQTIKAMRRPISINDEKEVVYTTATTEPAKNPDTGESPAGGSK